MKPVALILHSFGLFATQPPHSSAYSTALLRRAGIRTKHVDIGVAVWNKLLSQKYLASRELQHVLHDPIHGQVQANDWDRLRADTLPSIDRAKLVLRDFLQEKHVKIQIVTPPQNRGLKKCNYWPIILAIE